MAVERKRLRWPWVVLTLLVLYVLSYAPAMLWRHGPDEPSYSFDFSTSYFASYTPVEWLIDRTPMNRPLRWWARVWGVERVTIDASLVRKAHQEHQP